MALNPDARLSIVAYRPKPGKEAEVISLPKEHTPFLRSLGLATEREAVLATASEGTVIEVFEWVEGGIEKAHSHARLMKPWGRFSATCDFVPLNTLEECGMVFPNFFPLD